MRVLIAYYSRTDSTKKVALAIEKNFRERGFEVDVEKIRPKKEHSFFAWWHIRMVKKECEILPPKIKDVSKYDVVCIGSPNWTRLSLPVARYLSEIKGLKYKNVGLFATTALMPQVEWYIISAYLLELTFTSIVSQRGGRPINSLLLSSIFKHWNCQSEYGKRKIKEFCDKLETPIRSFKEYFLEQKEVEGTRLVVVFLSAFLLAFLFFQIVSSFLGAKIFAWKEFSFLFIIGFFAYFSLLSILTGKVWVSWSKYLTAFLLVSVLTILILFLIPYLGRPIVLGYTLIFIIVSFFRDQKTVFFTGAITLLSYFYLFFSYPIAGVLSPALDMFLLAVAILMIGAITRNMQRNYISLLETQDEIEAAMGTLEIKIAARTKELKELSESLEKQVEKRTGQLQEKIQELERFNKLSVGRELKMVSLKAEIKGLKEELEKTKGRR